MTQVPRWSMSQTTTLRWSFERDIEAYVAAGVRAIGVSMSKLRATGIDRAERLIRDAGLAVSALGSIGPFDLSKELSWKAQLPAAYEAIDRAARLEAGCLMLLTGFDPARCWEENATIVRSLLGELLPRAAARGVRIAIEPNHALRVDLGFLHTLDDGLDFVDEFDSPSLGVVFEINNVWIEPRLYRNIAERTPRIFLVQVNDYRIGTLTTPERVVMGDGDIPLRRILHALRDAGYSDWYDIEILGPAIEIEGYDSVLPRSIRAFRSLWS